MTDGTAIAGADYQATSGTLTWAEGESADKSFTISIVDDNEFEGDETVNIDLASATGAGLGSLRSAVLSIVDDELAVAGTVELSASSYSAGEGDGFITISVTRNGGAKGAVSIDYSTNAGTQRRASIISRRAVLSWSDGDASQMSFQISLTNDSTDENNETLTVMLSNPIGGLGIGNPSTATVTIVDDDTTPMPSSSGGGSGILFVSGLLIFAARRRGRTCSQKCAV